MKYLYRIAFQFIKLYWYLFKPITTGVRILMVQNQQVVLVKHTYETAWYLPGGGLKRGETIEDAARREVKEEVGGILYDLQLVGIFTNFAQIKTDHVILFIAEDFSWEPEPTQAEIEQVAAFPLNQLPPDLSGGTKRRLAEYMKRQDDEPDQWPTLGLW